MYLKMYAISLKTISLPWAIQPSSIFINPKTDSIYVHKEKQRLSETPWFILAFIAFFTIHTILLTFWQNENEALCIHNYSNINNFSKLWNLYFSCYIGVIIELSEIYQNILINILFGEQSNLFCRQNTGKKGISNHRTIYVYICPWFFLIKKYGNLHLN